MSKKARDQLPTERKSKATKFTAFNETKIYGASQELKVGMRDFVFSTQVLLGIQAMVMHKATEITIRKLSILWCPLVEPGSASSMILTVKYEVNENMSDIPLSDIVYRADARISEYLHINITPTRPLVKEADHAFSNPWSVHIAVDGGMDTESKHPLGLLKIWCDIKIKSFLSGTKIPPKQFVAPTTTWTNVHYPYYIPYIVQKHVRGLTSIRWRDHECYDRFKSDIARHANPKLIGVDKHLPLMQILSQEDYKEAKKITQSCHIKEGGMCSCDDTLAQFLASVLKNNTDSCMFHGVDFDGNAEATMTGRMKDINEIPHISY
ncbi:movement protein [Sowthistle yellow vein virus]|uniref:Movement protein n=1 Tax=Sowthistle yellow vein virus TaxID=2358214 RepID=A0AAE7ADH8_9RHAB|nr:movement protein [Sowthistle yellow vein virus]QJQ80124.1 movement protein [Sowthistle yellow vein virus]